MGIPVSEVMTTDVVTVSPEDPWVVAVRKVEEHMVHALPVVDSGGCVVGVVAESDLVLKEELLDPVRSWVPRQALRSAGRRARALTVGEGMSRHPVTVSPDATLGAAARLMHRRRVGRLPVVDPVDGRLVGIVTRSDLLKIYLKTDEELSAAVLEAMRDLGETRYDTLVVEVAEGVVTIHGQVLLRSENGELERALRQVPGVVGVRCRTTWKVDDIYTASAGV